MKLPPGFRHQCNEVSRYGKKDAGTGEHLKTLRLLDKKKKTKQRGGWSQCVCLKFFRPDITSVYKAQWLFAVNRLVCLGVCLFLALSQSLIS